MANSKRRCKHCREYVADWVKLPVGTFCSTEHAIEWANAAARKASKKEYKARTNELKRDMLANDRSHWMKKAQIAFNAYIRARDAGKPCISCDRADDGLHQRHASHYRSVGACSSLRFDEANVHASCSICNNHLSGNIVGYRPRLIQKIGISEVERIESAPKTKRWDVGTLKQIESIYTKMLKLLHNS